MVIATLGIDLSKTTFHILGLDRRGEIVLRRKLSRRQLLLFTANRSPMLIGMEACGGAHFLGRALREQGHEVRLMPAQYVKPYVKTNKNDYLDAEAIAEAAQFLRTAAKFKRAAEKQTSDPDPGNPEIAQLYSRFRQTRADAVVHAEADILEQAASEMARRAKRKE
jgi:transposase